MYLSTSTDPSFFSDYISDCTSSSPPVCECLLVVMSSSRNVTRMSSSVIHETNGSVPWSSRLTTLRICTSSTLRDKKERVPRSSRRSSFHLMYVPVVHLRCEFSRRSAKCLLAIEAIKSAPSSSRPRYVAKMVSSTCRHLSTKTRNVPLLHFCTHRGSSEE